MLLALQQRGRRHSRVLTRTSSGTLPTRSSSARSTSMPHNNPHDPDDAHDAHDQNEPRAEVEDETGLYHGETGVSDSAPSARMTKRRSLGTERLKADLEPWPLKQRPSTPPKKVPAQKAERKAGRSSREVSLHFQVSRILDIDTQNMTWGAQIFISVQWKVTPLAWRKGVENLAQILPREHAQLDELVGSGQSKRRFVTEEDVDAMKAIFWPQLYYVNLIGKADEFIENQSFFVERRQEVHEYEPSCIGINDVFVCSYSCRIEGTFQCNMRLFFFPVDFEDLSGALCNVFRSSHTPNADWPCYRRALCWVVL